MVGSALSFCLDQNAHAAELLRRNGFERIEQLEAVGIRRYVDCNGEAIDGRGDKAGEQFATLVASMLGEADPKLADVRSMNEPWR